MRFHFCSVQAEVIPAVLQSASNGYLMGQGGYRPRDICVSAPTGSGKTLSFVIPIVQVSFYYQQNTCRENVELLLFRQNLNLKVDEKAEKLVNANQQGFLLRAV